MKGGLGRARAAQNADDLPALDVQVDVGQGVAAGLFRVLEAHVVKVDRAVLYLHHRVLGFCRVLSSERTSTIRSALSADMVTMTKIMESIIRLIRIWKL